MNARWTSDVPPQHPLRTLPSGPSLIAMDHSCPTCSHPRPCSCSPVVDALGAVADVAGSVVVESVGEVGSVAAVVGGLEVASDVASSGVLETIGDVIGGIGGVVVDVVSGVFDGLG